jgi:hypothetical protein
MPWWSRNPCWDEDYDGASEPSGEKQELTRNGETVADALTGKSEENWNRGTHGWHNCDYTDSQHAQSWEHTDVDAPAMSRDEADALIDMNQRLKDGNYER